MNFEYDEVDKKHACIMESLAVPCRSNRAGFKEGQTQRIDAIRKLLADSGYQEVLLPSAQIWRKDFNTPISVIVSSHVDTVDSITKCSSELSDTGYYKGTYDNAGTNSAAVIAMLEGDISSNVVFAFTADEETGRCMGAKQVLEYARNTGNEPICIALDVTYEGYDDGLLFSIENLSSGNKKNEDEDFLNEVANAALSVESEGVRTCTFVKLHKDAIPSAFPKEYVEKSSGWFDEAQAYVKEHAKAFSLCLPCDGDMHGNRGVKVRQPTFEGYVNALEVMIYSFTKMHESLIEAKKMENATLASRIAEMIKEEEASKPRYSWYSGGSYDRSYSDEEWDAYMDYVSYNSSYGVDDDYDSPASMYDPSVHEDFEDYIGEIIDELYELANCYDEDDKGVFIQDALLQTPEDFKDWFGGINNLSAFLSQIFDEIFGLEADEDRDLRCDEDGYEYEKSILDYIDGGSAKRKEDDFDYYDDDDYDFD